MGLTVRREWWLAFDDGHLDSVTESISMEYANTHPSAIFRHPDLIIDHPLAGLIIVEIDGKAHDHYVTKTNERNELYKKAGMKLIVLNKANLKMEGLSLTEGFQDGFKRLFED